MVGRSFSLAIRENVFLLLAVAGFVKSEKSNGSNRTIGESLVTYVEYFEKQFLQETEQFYKLESATFLAQNSVNDYIKKVNSTTVLSAIENECSSSSRSLSVSKKKRIVLKISYIQQQQRK